MCQLKRKELYMNESINSSHQTHNPVEVTKATKIK